MELLGGARLWHAQHCLGLADSSAAARGHRRDVRSGLAQPEPWTIERATADYIEKLAQGIVAFEMPITRLEGKRKLSQNRPGDIESAATGLRAFGDATGQVVAAQMFELARSAR